MEARRSHPKHKKVDLVGPILLMSIGAILLFNNLGYLNWSIWSILWRFWPVIIIGWGLELLIGQQAWWGSLLTAGLLILVIGGAIWYAQTPLSAYNFDKAVTIHEPLEDFNSANVILSPEVGKLTLTTLDDSASFVEGKIYTGRGERIQQDFTVDGEATFTIKAKNSSQFIGAGGRRAWDLSFHPNVALDLNISTGVGDIELDLAELTLDNADVDFGVGQCIITLSDKGKYNLHISGGIGNLVIKIPQEMAVRINTDIAIVGRNIPTDYTSRNSTYTSPGYDDARNRANIDIDLGIGSLTIKQE